MVSVYPVLVGEIAKRGYRKSAIAKRMGVSSRTLYSKLAGTTEFTLSEANIIQRDFFPDMDKDSLFAMSNDTQNST